MKEYSQRDEKWSKVKLGFSKTSTIGKYGCKLTCFAMLSEHRPDVMNEQFKKDGCFCGDLLDDNKCAQSLKWKYLGKKLINPQRKCIAEVDFSPVFGVQQHFVVYDPTKKKIFDPWTGTWKPENTYKFISYRVFSMPKTTSKKAPQTKEEQKVVSTYQNEVHMENPIKNEASTSTDIAIGNTTGSTPLEHQFNFEDKTFIEKLRDWLKKFL